MLSISSSTSKWELWYSRLRHVRLFRQRGSLLLHLQSPEKSSYWINKVYKLLSNRSAFLGVPTNLAHCSKVVFLPTKFDLFLFLVSWDFHLVQNDLTFIIFLLTLQYDLYCWKLGPVAQLPVHLDVLILSENQKSTFNAAIQNSELSSLLRFDLCWWSGILHYFPELLERYIGWVSAS